MQHVILLLLYVDDLVLFSYDVDNMQNLLGVFEEFCHSSGLAINVEKTKMMVVQTIQPHHYPISHIAMNIYNLFKALNSLVLMG